MVSGAFTPTLGRIRFQGCDITGLAQHEFARIDIAKSLQITNVFKQLSAHENVRVAARVRSTRFELLRSRASLSALIAKADESLTRVGLAALRNKTAGDLAHGQQRAPETAMALASDPVLLLMDESTAGMSPEESGVMMRFIELVAEHTVVLVEHQMKPVMSLCERLIVLHEGEFLAEGTTASTWCKTSRSR